MHRTVFSTSGLRDMLDRVATDLENLEKLENLNETSQSQGISLKSQGICNRIPKVREVRKVREFCCLKFIFSQGEDPNFENCLVEHAPRAPSMVSDSWESLILVWKSQENVREFHIVWKVATLIRTLECISCSMIFLLSETALSYCQTVGSMLSHCLVNQLPKIDQSDSFLPTKMLANKTLLFFTCWLSK